MTAFIDGQKAADRLVEILKARGCVPERQRSLHEVRDAVHETVHVIQSGSKSYNRETIHEGLLAKAKDEDGRQDRSLLLRFELQARAVEKIICERFKIEYDIEHWALIMWMETSKTLNVDIGSLDRTVDAINIVAKQYETKRLVDQVLRLRMPRKAKAA